MTMTEHTVHAYDDELASLKTMLAQMGGLAEELLEGAIESLVKRDAGAKDAGSVFGAHGGALDRVDAALFTIVAGYYVSLAVIH